MEYVLTIIIMEQVIAEGCACEEWRESLCAHAWGNILCSGAGGSSGYVMTLAHL